MYIIEEQVCRLRNLFCKIKHIAFKIKRLTILLLCHSFGNSRYLYQNELDKACSQHDMAYEDFKDLPRRKSMMDINKVSPQWFINFLVKSLLM